MPVPARRRQSPLEPTKTPYPLSLIEDGETILLALASVRFATGPQIQRIIFNRIAVSERMARHRATWSLRRLFDAGLIRRVPVFAPSAASGRMARQVVNVLSATGARAIGVEPRWVRSRVPKDNQILTHEFWLMELAVLAMEGCPPPLSITTWWDDRMLAARKRQGHMTLSNIPDALLVVQHLESGKVFPSFIELDLGTESVAARSSSRRDFGRKIEGYLDYVDGPFQREFGIEAAPIVLIVATSERRLASLRATTSRLGGAGRYWFATLDRLRTTVANEARKNDFAARQGPFWASNWQTAVHDGWRSLAARCGA